MRVVQGQRLAQLPGRAWGQDLHEVLPQGLQSAQEAEETVSVRVLGFLPPLLFRRPSRRSFDHATRYARVRRRDPCHVRKRLRDAPYFRLDTITGSEYVPHLYIHLSLREDARVRLRPEVPRAPHVRLVRVVLRNTKTTSEKISFFQPRSRRMWRRRERTQRSRVLSGTPPARAWCASSSCRSPIA